MPHGGGGQRMHFPLEFFGWLHRQLIVVDDYAYGSKNFRWDPNIPLPLGEQWIDGRKT